MLSESATEIITDALNLARRQGGTYASKEEIDSAEAELRANAALSQPGGEFVPMALPDDETYRAAVSDSLARVVMAYQMAGIRDTLVLCRRTTQPHVAAMDAPDDTCEKCEAMQTEVSRVHRIYLQYYHIIVEQELELVKLRATPPATGQGATVGSVPVPSEVMEALTTLFDMTDWDWIGYGALRKQAEIAKAWLRQQRPLAQEPS